MDSSSTVQGFVHLVAKLLLWRMLLLLLLCFVNSLELMVVRVQRSLYTRHRLSQLLLSVKILLLKD